MEKRVGPATSNRIAAVVEFASNFALSRCMTGAFAMGFVCRMAGISSALSARWRRVLGLRVSGE